MKRDLDLIRKIVLTIEDHQHGRAPRAIEVDGYTDEQIGYHSYLIVDAGLADGIDATCMDNKSPEWIITHLTSAGHDFADAIRNDTVWSKTKSKLVQVGSGASIQIVTQLAASYVKSMLGIS